MHISEFEKGQEITRANPSAGYIKGKYIFLKVVGTLIQLKNEHGGLVCLLFEQWFDGWEIWSEEHQTEKDLNTLNVELRKALDEEDYLLAQTIKNKMDKLTENESSK